METVTTMNQYGAQAQRHWQTHRAQEYAQIEDPTAFFTTLGEQIAAEIERRRNELDRQAGTGQDESFLANLQTLNSTSLTVVDEVMREMAFTSPGELS